MDRKIAWFEYVSACGVSRQATSAGEPPPLAAIQPLVPRSLDRVIRTCLVKGCVALAAIGQARAPQRGLRVSVPQAHWNGVCPFAAELEATVMTKLHTRVAACAARDAWQAEMATPPKSEAREQN